MKRLLTVLTMLVVVTMMMAKPKVVHLTTENMTNPLGLSTHTPRLSWQIAETKNNTVQTAYHVLVATSPELLVPGKADLWDTGLVQSDQQLWLAYAGKKLKDTDHAYWTVRVKTNNGETAWAEPQRFSIGLTVESHWAGRWIGIDELFEGERQGYRSRIAARYLRKEIDVKAEEIKRATAYVAAVGLYEFYINGQKQGVDVLAPQPTDTRKSIIYNTFDITDALRAKQLEPERKANQQGAVSTMMSLAPEASKTCFGIALGAGRAFPMRQSKPHKSPFMGFPKCRVNIIIEYADGTKQKVSTDESWKLTANGPIRANNEFDGEEYDARMELGDWSVVGYDDSKWIWSKRTDIPMAELIGQPAPNMRVLNTLKPKSINTISGGRYIIDFGQNMAGWIQMKVRGNSGDTIRIKFAEKLNPDGTLYLANFRDALSEDIYVCNGKENGSTWRPTFITHGFRYAMVTGYKNATAADFEAQVVSDDMVVSGNITTSNTVLNNVYRNAYWGILSNYKGMPVDCPQRNERQPWLGDRTMGAFGEAYIFNNERLYSKWMRDICESQRTDGVFSDVAPAFWNYYNDDVTWPSALPFICEMIYRQYGNKQPIIDSYPYIKKWMNHILTEYMEDYIITRDKYGDWCVPPEDLKMIHSQDPARQTDGTLISTAYTIKNLRLMQMYAEMQGFTADKEEYAALEKNMTEAFNKKFLTIKRGTSEQPGHILYPDSVFYGNNSATSNLLPLALGIVPADCKDEVVKNLVTNICGKNGDHVSCGVIGISWLMRTLSENGRADLAYRIASQKTYPSWGYMVEQGATTIWELWNGDKANPRMNSGNHVMLLGDLLIWYYENLAGIKNAPGSVAFKKLMMKPNFEIQDLDNVDASYQTPYGMVKSQWTKTLEQVVWNITLPANTTADVYLPDGTVKTIGSGTHTLKSKIAPHDKSIVNDEFVYDQSIYPETHASSIVELKNGDLVATYFGGTKERNPDVCIWTQIKKKGSDTWSAPVLAADGVFALGSELGNLAGIDTLCAQANVGPVKNLNIGWAQAKSPEAKNNKALDGYYRKACWNPVLFQMPSGELWLFFKIGLKVADWTGWLTKSTDGGKTWSEKEPLPQGFLGPVKNKPEIINDRLICPTSTEGDGWKFHVEILDLKTNEWKYVKIAREDAILTTDMVPVLPKNGNMPEMILKEGAKKRPVDCIQPSILKHKDGRLQMVGRTRNGRLASTFSSDNGDTWTPVTLLNVPQNQSGTDAVTLKDGRHVLIYNNVYTVPGKRKDHRSPCSLAISEDGITWNHFLTLEDSPIGQYSYPSIIQGKDGSLHCIYTWRRQRISYKQIKLK